jgi:hypothetical protein
MKRQALQFAVAVAAAGAFSLAQAAGCPWLGENVPYDAAADQPADSAPVQALVPQVDDGYVFSEANFPPASLPDADAPMAFAGLDRSTAP